MPSKNHFSTLYLSAPDVIELVQRKGVEACLRGIADYIRPTFCAGARSTNPHVWPATRATA